MSADDPKRPSPDPDATVTDVHLPPAALTPPAPPTLAGELLPRSWVVLRQVRPAMHVAEFFLIDQIGLGGNGVVYRAMDHESGGEAALKFVALPPGHTADLARFHDTIRLLERLKHPAIVTPHAIRQYEDLYYLVLELYLGPYGQPMSLRDYAKLCGGMIEPAIMRKIFLHLLDAVGYMHKHGVLHCDLKPANVLFRFKGSIHRNEEVFWRVELKLTDFGLVQLLGERSFKESVDAALARRDSGAPRGPDTDSLLLTYDYMSPQQRRGEAATVQTDIYAMGLMLYRLLVGAAGLPFRKASDLRPHRIDPAWDEIITGATHEDESQRYASATDMAKAIAALPL